MGPIDLKRRLLAGCNPGDIPVNIKIALKSACAPLSLAIVLTASPALGQDATGADAGDQIIVTGSRVSANPETANANPIVTLDAETILQSGETNLTNLLVQTPALFNSITNSDAAGFGALTGGVGINVLDLRNLGPQRTLVLVNGRRHVSALSGQAAVDINTIPVALVDRIDILTGGVSSVYGADGVSGVVNFVTKRDFEGIDARAQYGVSDFGDADSYYGSITAGTNFAGGRGNIAASYEYRRDDRVERSARPNGQFASERLVRNPNDFPDDPAVPDNIPQPFIGWANSSVDGALVIDFSFLPEFRGGGQPYVSGAPLPGTFFSTGSPDTSDTPVADYDGDLQAQTEHHNANLLFSYELTPSIRFFAEGKYVNTDSFSANQPTLDLGTYISSANPFMPANVRDAVNTRGTFGGVLVFRDNFDFGRRGEALDRDVFRGVAGFEGDLTDNVRFETSYVYGRNKTDYVQSNFRIADRYFASLDAVDEGQFLTGIPNGNVVCRSSIDGSGLVDAGNFNYGAPPQTFAAGDGQCQPLNIFGEGVASPAALDFVLTDLENEYTLTQHVLNGFISGDFGSLLELPGGPVSFALGAEYREEKSVTVFDPLLTGGADFAPNVGLLLDAAQVANETGAFDVKEAFAELVLPILSDVPGAELLEVRAAVRLSDYSTTGYADSWSFSGIWAPLREVSFRGSYSQATRAPNITELFSPARGAFVEFNDPCAPANINAGTEFRAANCEALITGLGADPDTFFSPSGLRIGGTAAGNADLRQESATTWTAGLVLQPAYAPGLALTLDWFDIRIEDAINIPMLDELAEFCVDSPTLDNEFCSLVERESGTAVVVDYQLSPVNVAFFETAGLDATLRYQFEAGDIGDIALRGTLGYLDKLVFLPSNGGMVDDNRGELGAPKWNGSADVTWSKDIFTLNYGVQYIGPQLRYELDEIAANPDIAAPEFITIGDRFIHDIRAEVSIMDEQFSLYGGVNNFTNEQPALASAQARFEPTGWRGRYFYGGVRVRFDGFRSLIN